MKEWITMSALTLFLSTTIVLANAAPKEHEELPVIIGSEELQKMKTLAGRWEGTHMMGEEDELTQYPAPIDKTAEQV